MPGCSTLPILDAGQVQIPQNPWQLESKPSQRPWKNQLKEKVNKQQNYLALSNSEFGIDQSKQQIH